MFCPFGKRNTEYPHTRTSCQKYTRNAIAKDRKCVCWDAYIRDTEKKCKFCPPGPVKSDGKCVKCAIGVELCAGRMSRLSCGLCCGYKYLPRGAIKCVPCPSGRKRARSVAGNLLIFCAPIDGIEN